MKKTVSILGVTGSIGENTVDVILQHREKFDVIGISGHKNVEKLIEISKKLLPKYVVIADESLYPILVDALQGLHITLLSGKKGLATLASIRCDICISAIVGIAGLEPTYTAIEAGSNIGLANKESLVCAGEMIMQKAKEKNVIIFPIDSEHNAIFQAIADNKKSHIHSITLTASGGPFRTTKKEDFQNITKEMALKHPKWEMGQKISIDSATMINKGLEVIEAYHLFGVSPEQIEVVVHPESIIHGMVTFCDGSSIAMLGNPDMRIAISYVLGYPERLEIDAPVLNLSSLSKMHFETPDYEKFEGLHICQESLLKTGAYRCILNVANEVAVAGFLEGKIGFLDVVNVMKETLKMPCVRDIKTIQDVLFLADEAKHFAEKSMMFMSKFREIG